MENADDLCKISGEGGFEKVADEYQKYLVARLQDFVDCKDIKKWFDESTEIYTELPFAFMTTKSKDPDLFKAIERHSKKKYIPDSDEQPVWIHGFADLVFYNGNQNTVIIVDYKSDTKGDMSAEKFREYIHNKYDGQLILYKHAIGKIFHTEIENVETETWNMY
jgi:ATP-dependent exoDNAse (exonuclease V) beta subunit